MTHPDDSVDRTERFTVAYRASYVDVLRFVRRRVPGHDGAEITAEVFTVAWRRWDDAPDDVRPWLFGIAYKVMSQHVRSWRRRRALELKVAAEPVADAPGHGVEDDLDLKAAWLRLSARDREALALVAWDGLTGEEAAKVLGVSRQTFAARLSRARRRFEQELGGEVVDGRDAGRWVAEAAAGDRGLLPATADRGSVR